MGFILFYICNILIGRWLYFKLVELDEDFHHGVVFIVSTLIPVIGVVSTLIMLIITVVGNKKLTTPKWIKRIYTPKNML